MFSQKSWLLGLIVAVVAVVIALIWRNPDATEPLCACAVAQPGSHVRVRYELRNGDTGATIEPSQDVDTIIGVTEDTEFLDAAVEGMSVGETKETRFGGDAGFGERDPDWVVEYDRELFKGSDFEIGTHLELSGRSARVASFTETTVTLDFNHPLAGVNATLMATLISCTAPCGAAPVMVDTISLGDGVRFPRRGDRVRVHCNASYADDGEVFYSSHQQGQPYEFQLGAGEVIKGLDIGIKNISVGGIAKLKIPADLAYGRQSSVVMVPVKRDVIYEVELLSIS